MICAKWNINIWFLQDKQQYRICFYGYYITSSPNNKNFFPPVAHYSSKVVTLIMCSQSPSNLTVNIFNEHVIFLASHFSVTFEYNCIYSIKVLMQFDMFSQVSCREVTGGKARGCFLWRGWLTLVNSEWRQLWIIMGSSDNCHI